MNFNNINKQKLMEALGGAMGNGVNAANLSDAINSGNLNNVLKNLNPTQAAELKSVLSNEAAMNKILNSPEAVALLKKFM